MGNMTLAVSRTSCANGEVRVLDLLLHNFTQGLRIMVSYSQSSFLEL